jgi:hypothetical protein
MTCQRHPITTSLGTHTLWKPMIFDVHRQVWVMAESTLEPRLIATGWLPLSMAKGYRKNNLVKARNLRHDNSNMPSLETDSESDCGYEGGVNCESSDDEYKHTSSDEGWSSDGSLAELERDELEANLCALREEAESLDAPTVFRNMMAPTDAKGWKKAEGNQAFGYTKNSTRTQERRRKEAREQAEFQEKAKTS